MSHLFPGRSLEHELPQAEAFCAIIVPTCAPPFCSACLCSGYREQLRQGFQVVVLLLVCSCAKSEFCAAPRTTDIY